MQWSFEQELLDLADQSLHCLAWQDTRRAGTEGESDNLSKRVKHLEKLKFEEMKKYGEILKDKDDNMTYNHYSNKLQSEQENVEVGIVKKEEINSSDAGDDNLLFDVELLEDKESDQDKVVEVKKQKGHKQNVEEGDDNFFIVELADWREKEKGIGANLGCHKEAERAEKEEVQTVEGTKLKDIVIEDLDTEKDHASGNTSEFDRNGPAGCRSLCGSDYERVKDASELGSPLESQMYEEILI